MSRRVRLRALLIALLLVLSTLGPVGSAQADSRYHVVRPGETLCSIGRLYGVNAYDISRLNCLSNPDYIRIGQRLQIPAPTSAPSASAAPSPSYYTPVYQYPSWGGWAGWYWGYYSWPSYAWQPLEYRPTWYAPAAAQAPAYVPTYTPQAAPELPYGAATAICRDGTLSYSQHRQGTCSWHGGVATWLK